MIPGPRPPEGHDRPAVGRDRSRSLRSAPPVPRGDGPPGTPAESPQPLHGPLVALTRCPQGWAVISPAGLDEVDDLVEGLSLADLVAEEFGVLREPDRSARRSARGNADGATEGTHPLVDARIAALERTVAQLEHALAARVATERAIGILAERHGTSARAAFEELRRDARSQGRPLAELARGVLESLAADAPTIEETAAAPAPRGPVHTTSSPAVARRLPGQMTEAGADTGS